MRKLVIGVLAGLAFAGVARAGGQNEAGCGWGSMLFKDNNKGHQILAATTNGTFGNQTFGITTGTGGCAPSAAWWAKRRAEQEKFVAVNLRDLSRELAVGRGEYVTALSGLMGCSSAEDFGAFAQSKYEAIIPGADAAAGAVIENLRSELRKDSKMAASCGVL